MLLEHARMLHFTARPSSHLGQSLPYSATQSHLSHSVKNSHVNRSAHPCPQPLPADTAKHIAGRTTEAATILPQYNKAWLKICIAA